MKTCPTLPSSLKKKRLVLSINTIIPYRSFQRYLNIFLKMHMTEIKEDIERISWIGRLNITKMLILPKAIFPKIQYNLYQIPKDSFCRNRKIHSKIHRKSQRTLNSQNNPGKRIMLEDSHF